MQMNAQLPPKPKIDIRQYINQDKPPLEPLKSTKPVLRKTPPPLPVRPVEQQEPQQNHQYRRQESPPLPPRRPSTVENRTYGSIGASPIDVPAPQVHPRSASSVDLSNTGTSSGLLSRQGSTGSILSPPVSQASSPQRTYAPKPTHTSVPLKTHLAENSPPSQIPTGFLGNKSRKVLAANNRYICVASATKTQLYSWRTSSLVWQIKHMALCATFVAETDTVWIGTSSGKVLVIDVEKGDILQILERGHTKAVTFIATSSFGVISLSSDDGKFLVWSPRNNGSPFKVNRVRAGISGRGALAVTGGFRSQNLWLCKNREIEVYHPVDQVLPLASTSLPGRGNSIGSITSVAAFDDLAFFGLNDGFIAVFKATQQLGVVNGGIYSITALTAPSSTELWAGTRSGEILIFSLQTTFQHDEQSIQLSASLLRQWKAHASPITQIVLAEHKAAVLSIDRSGSILAWNSTPTDIMPTLPSADQGLSVQVVSWNIGACSPDSLNPNDLFTANAHEADIVAVGLQEVVELENTSQHAINMVRPADLDLDKEHIKWQQFLEAYMIPHGFTLVVTKSMVGIMTCLFVKRHRASYVSNVRTDLVKTGIGGTYGNKGGVVVECELVNMSWCFVNCHLAAGHTNIIQRNRDASQILTPERLKADVCLFFGDTNYRINAAREQAEQIVKRQDWTQLQKHDQLLSQISKIPSFCLGRFQEGMLNFAPTYKYDRGSNNYDTSDKKRIPSWCDRILFRGKSISVIEYHDLPEVTASDHKPVVGTFSVPLLV